MSEIFKKISGSKDINKSGLSFGEFNELLENIAMFVYKNNNDLIGTY
jgi:hypothetical protein